MVCDGVVEQRRLCSLAEEVGYDDGLGRRSKLVYHAREVSKRSLRRYETALQTWKKTPESASVLARRSLFDESGKT